MGDLMTTNPVLCDPVSDFNARRRSATTTERRYIRTSTVADKEEEGQRTTGNYLSILSFFVQASFAGVARGVVFSRRSVEIAAKYSVETLRSLSSAPGPDREKPGILIDVVRGYFREIAELGEDEARRFQAEVEILESRIWPTSGAEKNHSYRRRWRVKE